MKRKPMKFQVDIQEMNDKIFGKQDEIDHKQEWFNTEKELADWKECAKELAEALKLSISRETPDQNHDWVTCKQPSCLLGREALARFEKMK